ncbi:hypothetical protein JTE90_017453 [Oedothorax gibbosus]|uniref:Ig-like domain-containing protein n=1 Tax=Oedothorax gibbosus TaxID=931172 RepID=A0AAV6U3J7_9ARAC|nr:hypothetical protein JTE90_017453 [Oedothorax gibbosus]
MEVLHLVWSCIIFVLVLATDQSYPKIKEFSFPAHIPVGEKTSAMCFAISSESPVTFSWMKDGKEISSPDISIKNDKEFSVIIINPVSLSSSGNFTCVAKNSHGAVSFSTSLLVVDAPKWVVEPSNVTATVGENIVLKCSASGSPNPKVEWKKLEKNISLMQNVRFKPVNGSLSFSAVSIDDEGEYECSANNGVDIITKRISITVKGEILETSINENIR